MRKSTASTWAPSSITSAWIRKDASSPAVPTGTSVSSLQGQLVETWKLDFVPQAISLRKADGAVFVGGQGWLARLTPEGIVEQQEEFPRPMTDEEIEEAVQEQVSSQVKMFDGYLRGLRAQLAQIEQAMEDQRAPDDSSQREDEEEAEDDEQATSGGGPAANAMDCVTGMHSADDGISLLFKEDTPLPMQVKAVEQHLELLEEQYGGREKLEDSLREQMERASRTSTYTGIAVAEEDLFVIASAPGYSYNAWRTNHDLREAKLIVKKGLRGCCGQMDCQTYEGDLVDPDEHAAPGLPLRPRRQPNRQLWKTRTGNRRRVRRLLRAEEHAFRAGRIRVLRGMGPPVCVKRFSLDGDFQDVVCFPLYETGCVRVAVDLWDDKVFLLSPNQNAIYVFAPQREG